MPPEVVFIVVLSLVVGALVIGASIYGWMHTTKLKIQIWGQSLRPTTDSESKERIKLLTHENAELRAELGSLKDRLGNVERIVTDSGFRLTHQIDRLRDEGNIQ
jgi:hypothetical protein